MNSITIKVIGFFISLFIIITVASQIYFSINDKHETKKATLYTTNDTIPINGIFVRNETQIPNTTTGVLSYTNPDGSKVAKNSIVAEVYSSEEQIIAMHKIDELKEELKQLKRVQNRGVTDVAQPEFLSEQIDEKYKLIENYIEHNDFEKLVSTRSEMLVLMNIYNIITEAETNYEVRIAEVNAEIAQLGSIVSAPISTISVNNPGYFVSYVDGYENQLSFNTINDLTADDIKKITSKKIENSTKEIGKIIDGYNWKMIGIIKTSNRFFQSEYVDLRFSNTLNQCTVFVDSIKQIDDTDEYIIILSCDQLNFDLVQNRVEKAEIIFKEYTGIEVPRTAMRFINNQKGVYVLLGQNIIFKKINVIYEGDDYVLSEVIPDSEYLLLHDQILLEEVTTIENFDSQW